MIDGDLFHIGCYTAASGGGGEGITLARRNPRTGALAVLGVVARSESPSFLAYHPRLPVLYAANELDQGAVCAWTIGSGGELTPLGGRPTGGAHPCHLAVSPSGRWLAVANYGSGSVAVFPLDDSGAPGAPSGLIAHRVSGASDRRAERQRSAHAHMVSWLDDDRLSAVDLGADAVFGYTVDAGGLRASGDPLRTPPGTGPRHLARGPHGWLYLVGELDATVTAYRDDPATGRPRERARLATSTHGGPVLPSEIAVDARGERLYVANRGPDSLAVFALDDGVPRYLTEVSCGGEWPRHFLLRDGFLYVANERSHGVATLRIAPETGVPEAVGAIVEVPSPTIVASRNGFAL